MYTIKLGTTLAKKSLKQLQKAGFSEKLKVFAGRKSRVFSRRLNVQHRVVYQVFPADHMIEVLSVWGHYVGA